MDTYYGRFKKVIIETFIIHLLFFHFSKCVTDHKSCMYLSSFLNLIKFIWKFIKFNNSFIVVHLFSCCDPFLVLILWFTLME